MLNTHHNDNTGSNDEHWRVSVRERIRTARELPVNELTFYSEPLLISGWRCVIGGAGLMIAGWAMLYFFVGPEMAGLFIFTLMSIMGVMLALIGVRMLNFKTSLTLGENGVVLREFVFDICTRKLCFRQSSRHAISVEHCSGTTTSQPRYRVWLRTPRNGRYTLAAGITNPNQARKIAAEARQLIAG